MKGGIRADQERDYWGDQSSRLFLFLSASVVWWILGEREQTW
jgi:hypothetical protein